MNPYMLVFTRSKNLRLILQIKESELPLSFKLSDLNFHIKNYFKFFGLYLAKVLLYVLGCKLILNQNFWWFYDYSLLCISITKLLFWLFIIYFFSVLFYWTKLIYFPYFLSLYFIIKGFRENSSECRIFLIQSGGIAYFFIFMI